MAARKKAQKRIVPELAALRREIARLREANQSLGREIEERSRLDRLIRDIAAPANRGQTVDDVLLQTVGVLCERGGWSFTHVFYCEPATGRLRPSLVWEPRDDPAFAAFRAATAAQGYASESGALTAAFEAGTPIELLDRGEGLDPTRPGLADTGLRRALMVPITAGDSRFGILELYSFDPTPAPEAMIAAMQLAASEIAHAMLRGQTEALSAQMESNEQQRIARDLHDGLGQRVSGIAMLAHHLHHSLEEQGAKEAAAAAELSSAIEEAKVELRALVRGLMPVYPDSDGLVEALYRLVDESTRASGVACTFEYDLAARIEDGFVTRHLYFIAQEALRNAIRHARPSQVAIRLVEANDHIIELSIRDDGIGLPESCHESGGSGLRIMRHRAALLTARYLVESSPGRGTAVRVRMRVGSGFARTAR
jgi:signal transduction histidine kinase